MFRSDQFTNIKILIAAREKNGLIIPETGKKSKQYQNLSLLRGLMDVNIEESKVELLKNRLEMQDYCKNLKQKLDDESKKLVLAKKKEKELKEQMKHMEGLSDNNKFIATEEATSQLSDIERLKSIKPHYKPVVTQQSLSSV